MARERGPVTGEKLFQNLRASRETELMAAYPVKDVSAWLGDSAPVAMKHYAMTLQDSFDRAIREGALPAAVVKLHQNPHQPAELEKAANRVICGLVTLADELTSYPARTRT